MRPTAIAIMLLAAASVSPAFAESSDQAEQRLTFLRERLEASKTRGMWWQWGWLAVSAGGLGYSVIMAADKEGSERTGYVAESVKSAIGVVYLTVQPMQARHGAKKIPEDRPLEEQVAVAEGLLKANAERSKERTDWKMYAGNTFLHGAGLGVTLGWGKKDDAWINFAAGMVLGSFQIWSQPGRPLKDWQEYQVSFEGAPRKTTQWWISPNPHLRGLTLNMVW